MNFFTNWFGRINSPASSGASMQSMAGTPAGTVLGLSKTGGAGSTPSNGGSLPSVGLTQSMPTDLKNWSDLGLSEKLKLSGNMLGAALGNNPEALKSLQSIDASDWGNLSTGEKMGTLSSVAGSILPGLTGGNAEDDEKGTRKREPEIIEVKHRTAVPISFLGR